jgi:two-component system alkaline phosphatase synthesis response regulator PhoP
MRSAVTEKCVDVLVVEDDEDSRDLLQIVLEAHHFLVRCAGTADEALEAMRARTPDVVLTDVNLRAGGTGPKLADAVRADPSCAHVAVIAVSGAAPRAELTAHFDAFVLKPVNVQELVTVVTDLVAERRVQRRGGHPRGSSAQ